MKRLSILLTIALLSVLMLSCEKNEQENPNLDGEGIVNLYLTDAPIDAENVTGVYITVTGIEYHKVDEGWITAEEFGDPQVYNLLELTDSISEMMGSFTLEAGMYSQIRFMIEAPDMGEGFNPSNPGCWIEFSDETTAPLFVPSGGQTGYKAVGRIMVPENGEITITADFDVRRSVVMRPNHDTYILKPVIRLVANDEAGRIMGAVENAPEDVDMVVYAYEAGTYTEEEAATPEGDAPRFPNAISSDKVGAEYDFQLWYLAEGDYDLVLVSSVDGEFQEVLQVDEGIEVESGMPTFHTIVLPTDNGGGDEAVK
ncbi:MAG: DUF4382 domain-containing protein [Bacteroidales bacterium]